MAVISNLDVNLIARTQKFDPKLKKSQGAFGGFMSNLKGGFGKLPGLATVAKVAFGAVTTGIGATTGAVVLLASKVNSAAKEIKDFERFGLLAGESLGQFRVLASRSSLPLEDLVDLTKDLGIRIGEANIDGGGEIFDTFKRLGLNVRELQGMDPANQLRTFSQAISQVENATERLALTDILLSDAGTKALNVMIDGAAGFDSAAESADKFGLSISQVDAAQLELARESMAELSLLSEGLWNQLTVQAAPILTAVVDMFVEGATEAEGFSGIIETGFEMMIEGIKLSLNGWDVMLGAINTMRSGFATWLGVVLNGLAKIEEFAVAVGGKRFDYGIGDLATAAEQVAIEFAEKAGQNFSDGFNGVAGSEFEKRLKEIRTRSEDIAEETIKLARNVPPPTVDWAEVIKGFSNRFNQAWEFASNRFGELFTKQEVNKPSVAAVARGSVAAQSAINRTRASQEDPQKVLKKSLEDGFKGTIKAAEKTTKAVDKVVKGLGNTVAQLIPRGG